MNEGQSDLQELYGLDLSDLPADNTVLDNGMKSYIYRIEKWAKDKLEEEKKESFVCFESCKVK